MVNLLTRARINDAWTSIALAEVHLSEGKYAEAREAIHDAEQHFVNAKSAVEQAELIVDSLTDLRTRLNQVRYLVSRASTIGAG
jgi:HEPN domain-containing protein